MSTQSNQGNRVLFLSPDISRPIFNQNGRLKVDRFLPPLGLGYLSAVLKNKGYSVKVIDCLGIEKRKLLREIKKFQPNLVGISCFTEHRGGSLELARMVKKIDNKIPIVFGGSHATFMYEQILSRFPEVDFCVLSEGEETFPELLKTILKKGTRDYDTILGIAFRKGNKIRKNIPRNLIKDLDSLPFPDRDWVKMETYEFPHPEARGKKIASMITSRGCPYGCLFCSTSQFWGKKIRFRSVENVIAEVDLLWRKGYRVLNFLDDTFTLDEKRVQEICRLMIAKKYNLLWCCSTRAGMVSKKTARLMKKAGCFSVTVGIESLSPGILENIGKKFEISQAAETFGNLKEAEITNGCLLMVGNMGENEKSIRETINNLKKVSPDSIFTSLTQIYPGTPFYEIAKEKGFLNDEYWLNENKAAPINLMENSLPDLLKFQKQIWKNFFWQKGDYPRWFLRKTKLGRIIWPIVGKIFKNEENN